MSFYCSILCYVIPTSANYLKSLISNCNTKIGANDGKKGYYAELLLVLDP